jgi:CheY-like chemotaxis protein
VASIRKMGATILVVEDDPAYGPAIADLLALEGHAVHLVTDGQAAIDTVRAMGDRLDLVLCDLLLPRRSGFEVVKEIVELDLAVPVLVMTSVYRSTREIHALKGLGVAGYMAKSAPFEHVLFRVNHLLFPARASTRGDHRVAVAIPVQFRAGTHVCYGTSYNLSVSGIYVRTHEPVIAGALIDMALGLPTAKQMATTRAEIMHSATPVEVRGTAYPAGFGARFVDPPALTRAAVRRYVDLVAAEDLGGPSADGVLAAEQEVEPAVEPDPAAVG